MTLSERATKCVRKIFSIGTVVLFVLGVFLALQSGKSRSTAYRQMLIAEHKLLPTDSYSEIDKMESAKKAMDARISEIHFYRRSFSATKFEDGIELSGEIQTLIHDLRKNFGEKGVDVENPSFGFEDYSREVALISEPSELKVLSVQIEVIRFLLVLLLETEPDLLLAVRREKLHKETPSDVTHPMSVGMKAPDTLVTQELLSFEIEFEGYTRVLRDFLNAVHSSNKPLRLSKLSVRKSHRSEGDDTFGWFSGGERLFVQHRSSESPSDFPFAKHLLETPYGSQKENETKPLIGEVISVFTLRFELTEPLAL